MSSKETEMRVRQIVGVDLHADQFTAALVCGRSAVNAQKQWTHHAVENGQWEKWLTRHVPADAVLVLEAGMNSFEFAVTAERLGFKAVVLESERVGKLAKTYCKTDRVDAAELARLYLSGLAPEVWQPDALTRQRRELCAAYARSVTDSTRSTNRLKNYLTGHAVRLGRKRLSEQHTREWIFSAYNWTAAQRVLIDSMFTDHDHARAQRHKLRMAIIRQALDCDQCRQLMKLCGIRAVTAFELVATVGDIRRFATAKKLVAYIGVNPSVRESANSSKPGRVRKRGCNRVRARLIQAAKSFMRAKSNEGNPVKRWGLAMKIRKGANKATVAVARKLAVAAWYILNGVIPKNLTTEEQVRAKLKKLTEEITLEGVRAMGYRSCSEFIEQYIQCFSLMKT
jgi:transposase